MPEQFPTLSGIKFTDERVQTKTSPSVGTLKTYPNGDVGRWDGEGWEIIDTKNPQLRTQLGLDAPNEADTLATVANAVADYVLPTAGAVVGGKLGGPVLSGLGAAAGKGIGDALQLVPELPGLAREFLDSPELGARISGFSQGALEGLGSASALAAGTAIGEKYVGPLLQRLPSIPLGRIARSMGLGGLIGGLPVAGKVAAVGGGYNAAAAATRGVGKALEWTGTPVKRDVVALADELPLSNIQKAILKATGEVPESVTIGGTKTPWADLAPKPNLAPRTNPDFPSRSIQELVQRMNMNAKGFNPEIAPLQSQIDDAVAKFLKGNTGTFEVRNVVKGSRLK
jgi:hypothetical protein